MSDPTEEQKRCEGCGMVLPNHADECPAAASLPKGLLAASASDLAIRLQRAIDQAGGVPADIPLAARLDCLIKQREGRVGLVSGGFDRIGPNGADAPPNEDALKDAITRALGVIQMWENADDARAEANRILSNALADLALTAPSPNVRELEASIVEQEEFFQRNREAREAAEARVRQLEQVLREIANSTHGPGGSRRRGPWLARLKSMARAALGPSL